MIAFDNYNCLPFYSSLDEQTFRRPNAYGHIEPLYCPNDRLLSFQMRIPHATHTFQLLLTSLTDDTLNADITGSVVGGSCWVVKENAYTDNDGVAMDIVVYSPNFSFGNYSMAIGRYYLILWDGAQRWYSEVFTVVDDLSSYTRLQWRCREDLPLADGGYIAYENLGFLYWNTLYFADNIGKPEYPFTEEGETRDGYFFPERQISSKTYKFFTNGNECLCDTLRLVRLSDIVNVRDGYGHEYPCDTFLATPTWEEQGDVASIAIEFTTATVVKHIGHGWTRMGDYNIDYNQDYNT